MATGRFKSPQTNYVTGLGQYLEEMRAHQAGLRVQAPDPMLLTNGLESWLPGVVSAEVIRGSNEPDYVAITFNKPKRTGTTPRQCDPEFLLVAILHVLHGGSFGMEAHGREKSHFYWRINVPDGKRAYALRLVVGTAAGLLTKEAREHHDLRRSALGRLMRQRKGTKSKAKHGRNMVDWSVAHFDAARAAESISSTSTEYGQLLWEAYKWLDEVPLCTPPHALPKAAE